jgi:hypothetical protein
MPSNRSWDQIVAALMAFLMTIVVLARSVKDLAVRRLPYKNESEENYSTLYPDSIRKEEFRPPSPSPGFVEADLFAAVLQRLGELEEKVRTLQEKPSEMPCEKEELLNAAVRRVDALEAELIVTKKVVFESHNGTWCWLMTLSAYYANVHPCACILICFAFFLELLYLAILLSN